MTEKILENESSKKKITSVDLTDFIYIKSEPGKAEKIADPKKYVQET